MAIEGTKIEDWYGNPGSGGTQFWLVYNNARRLSDRKLFEEVIDARPNVDVETIQTDGDKVHVKVTLLGDVPSLGTAFPPVGYSGPTTEHELEEIYKLEQISYVSRFFKGIVDGVSEAAAVERDKAVIPIAETVDDYQPALLGTAISIPVLVGAGLAAYFFAFRS